MNDNQTKEFLIFILPEIEIGREIDTLKKFNVTRFIWMMSSHSFIRNVNHGGVLDFVDCMVTYNSDPSSFCDQDYVVTFKEPDKTFDIQNVLKMLKFHYGYFKNQQLYKNCHSKCRQFLKSPNCYF